MKIGHIKRMVPNHRIPTFIIGFLSALFLQIAVIAAGNNNPPPVQVFYIPIPENDLLTALQTLDSGTSGPTYKPVDPMYTYVAISVFSDNTFIYYDQWENGFDVSINQPLNIYSPTNQGGTQIWGDNNPTNGMPPGFSSDLLNYGDVILLENSVISSNRTVIDFDAGDKVAATKPIAVTRAGWASASATLLAGANEVFDTAFFGTYFRSPVGVNIPDGTDYQQFEYVGFSIMAGREGATVKVDKDANGVYETTNILSEGEGFLINGGVYVGGQILSDKPIQVDLITGDIYEGFESRFMRLLPVSLWSASATTPVSTPSSAQGYTGNDTTIWLYNPATNTINVQYVTRTGTNLTATTLTIPGGAAGGYLKQVIPDGYGARFINTNGRPFHAVACIDSTGTTLSSSGSYGSNRTWDWGFVLVPEESLTPQILVGLGIGRDPTSSVNPSENASPIWVTPVGNGNTGITVYVDYDADPSTGPYTDANGYHCDQVITNVKELVQLKIYNPAGDQSGMLIYVLTNNVKLAAAWGSDPLLASPGQPGLDMGTGIPPLPLFVASKRSVLLTDNDNDGYISPGDVLKYSIIIENTGRQPVPDLHASDVLPSSLIYITNSTYFVNANNTTSSISDDAVPPAGTKFPLDEGGIDLPESVLPVTGIWYVVYQARVKDYTNLPPGTIDIENMATVGGVGITHSNAVVNPIRGKIGDYVWWDLNGDGIQSGGETGINGVVVRLLDTNGAPVLDDVGNPITAVTTNDSYGKPGFYRLTGVVAGSYIVDFTAPTGFVFTTPNADSQGITGTANSDAAILSGITVSFSIAGGQTITNIDAGLVEASSIGDYVWFDANGNGLQDSGEQGANGVTVRLLYTNGTAVLDQNNNPVVAVTANDSGGHPGYYKFDNLYSGNYIVEFVLPANTIFTTQNADGQGVAGTNNSDANTGTGRTVPFTLNFAQNMTSVDAGLLRVDLAVAKSVSHQAVSEGATITYTVVVSNIGPTLATGVGVMDKLTNGLTYVTNTVSQGSYNSGSGLWTVGTLAKGSIASLQIQATVNAGTMNKTITNRANISASNMPDPVSANNSAMALLSVSSLKIFKSSDVSVSVQPGQTIHYTIIVTNVGSLTHQNVKLVDAVPPGTIFVPGSVSVQMIPVPSPTTVVYNASSTFTVPAGVMNLTVAAWGGGGRGGTRTSRGSGGGGGGGAYSRSTFAVIAGNVYTVTVGAGSTLGTTPGGSSWFSRAGVTNVLAVGGNSCPDNNNVGQAGGSAAACIGDIRYNGGNGANGVDGSYGGGGGSSAGTNAAGNNAVNATGATAPPGGGNGGDGKTAPQGNGTAGSAPGGGGGGGLRTTSGTRTGGNGAAGRVTVTYAIGYGTPGNPPNLATGYTLRPNQSIRVSFAVTVDNPLSLMAITNTASVTSSIQRVALSTTIVDRVIPVDLGVTKNANVSEVNVGGAVSFTIGLTNKNPTIAATGVLLTDLLPSGFNFVSAIPSIGSYNSTSGVWTVGTLGAASNAILIINATAATGTAGKYLTNSVSITAMNEVDTNTINNTASAVVLVRGHDLILTKNVNVLSPNEGDQITYTVVVSNKGPSPATGVVVSEPLTNGLTYITNTVSQGSYNNGSGIWTVGNVPVGGTATLTISALVDIGTVGTYITNISKITAADLPDPIPANNTDKVVISVSGLRVIKTSNVSGQTYPGSNITYTIVVTNLGFTGHTNIAVTDLLPDGTVYVSGHTPPLLTNGVTLLPGQSRTMTLTVQVVNPCTRTQIVNTVSVVSDQQTVPLVASVKDPVAYTDLAIMKMVDNPNPNELDTIHYTIIVTNKGPISAPGIVVQERLTNGITYVSHSAGQGVYVPTSGVWSVGTINSGGSASLIITATVNAGTAATSITNRSRITASGRADYIVTNNTASAVINVIGVDIGVGKSVIPAVPFEKENLTYTIVVTNLGPSTATGVTVTDILPSGLDYVSHNASLGTYNHVSGLWTVGTLAKLQTATLSITAKVQEGMNGIAITNSAYLTSVNEVEINSANNSKSVVVTPEKQPLDIFKSSNVSTAADPGDRITYTILVTNQSSQTQTGVAVTDPLPAGVSYVSASTVVYAPVMTNKTFMDRFSVRQYSNNNGDYNWSGNWSESEGDGPEAGSIRITYDSVRGVADTLRVCGASKSIARAANIQNYNSATLSFVFRRDGLEAGEGVSVQVSSNGVSGTYTTLATFSGAGTDASYRNTNFNISAWRSTNTAIRFLTTSGTMDDSDRVWFDDVTITVPVREYAYRSGSAPSNLTSGITLNQGEWMTVEFQADVPTNPVILSITNRASVKSTQMSSSRTAEIIDSVRHVNVGVYKTVNDENPGAADDIWFTIIVTNRGAFTATGVQVADYWPTNQLIFKSASPSQGTYSTNNPSMHVWSVGNLAAGAYAKVVVTGQVDVAGKNIWITNKASIISVGQFDILKTDNNSEVGLLTVVVLSRFEAFEKDGKRWVEWETASETETEGFRLYRKNPLGGWDAVTSKKIRAVPASPQGGIYKVIDNAVLSGNVYTYKLVEIEHGGRKNEYGPFDVVVRQAPDDMNAPSRNIESIPRSSEQNSARIKEMQLTSSQILPLKTSYASWGMGGSGGGSGALPRLKVVTSENGVHYISAAQMADAFGILENVVRTQIGNGAVKIGNNGQLVRWKPAPANDGVYFVAEALRTSYSDNNVYWITWTTGMQVQAVSATNPPPPVDGGVFRDLATAEKDVYALTALFSEPDDDFWLWNYAAADDPMYDTISVGIRTPAPEISATHTAKLSVTLLGATSTGANNEHHVVIRLNGNLVGEDWWEGTVLHTTKVNVSQSLLMDGSNNVQITAVLDPGIEDSMFYLDNVAIEYWRRFESDGGLPIIVTGGTNDIVTVKGFATTNLEVWKVDDPKNPSVVSDVTIENVSGNCRVSFRPASSNVIYCIFDRSSCYTVSTVSISEEVDLASPTNAAEYVVITVPSLLSAAQSLVDLKATRGILSRVVALESIYDEFNYGIVHPLAIKTFLRTASTNWAIAPGYVVLAGAGSYDHKNCKGLSENLIPVYMTRTPVGLFASDGWYTDFDNDDVPNVPIGRFPALTDAELQKMVDKVAATENPQEGQWKRRILMLADDPDAGGDFTASSKWICNNLYEGDFDLWTINVEDYGLGIARYDMFDAWSDGALFVNYFGHGGLDRFASEGLLKTSDLDSLVNTNKPPVVTAMTCLIGRFELPGFDCLAESLLLKEGGGAVAVWAPSGLALNERSEQLARKFYNIVFEGQTNVLGDAILAAMVNYRDLGLPRHVLRSFNLLGDPSLILPGMVEWKRELPFAKWKRQVFTYDEIMMPWIADASEDPDNDGLKNFTEYALGRNPLVVDTDPVVQIFDAPAIGAPSYDVVLKYTRSKNADGTECRLEVSSDLMTWGDGSGYITDTQVIDDGNGQTETVWFYIKNPDPENGPCFIRLRTIFLP